MVLKSQKNAIKYWKKLKRKLTLDELSSSEKLTAIKDIGPTFAALISKNPELYLKESEIKNV